ncbi:MAG: selenocysteine-specific translation elongation factor [Deltaproteobacteria bacterium]|nr:selenocysteine-specific translation elongation factor [Deltaproteobacteria bacterium]
MEQFIIGTAGHIDHGKTSLVKALTGVDTDRLPEEKKRGITIELGFAHFFLPSGKKCSVIDVPGHEKFVRQMCGGAFGFDLALLVISAEEGIRPQTKEHFDILRLLQIPKLIAVLTHLDQVAAEWLEMVKGDVKKFLDDTPYSRAPVVTCDSISGRGIKGLLDTIDRELSSAPLTTYDGAPLFRLPVDRVFMLKGLGTVVTGTVLSGKIKKGGEVWVYPENRRVLVKELQRHGISVASCGWRQRLAVNLSGVSVEEISRGSFLISPAVKSLPMLLLARIEWVSSFRFEPSKRPFKCQLQFGLTTLESSVSIHSLPYGEILLSSPLPILRGDHFILRGFSPLPHYGYTIGGGEVLDAVGPKHHFCRPLKYEEFRSLDIGSLKEITDSFVRQKGLEGSSPPEMAFLLNAATEKASDLLSALAKEKKCICSSEGRYIDASAFERTKESLLLRLREYHNTHPLKGGIPLAQWRSTLRRPISDPLWDMLLDSLLEEKIVRLDGSAAHLKSFIPKIGMEDQEILQKLLSLLQEGGKTPPTLSEMAKALGKKEGELRSHLQYLIQQRSVVKVKDDLYYPPLTLHDLQEHLYSLFRHTQAITPQNYREATGLSRKYTIPLLEYFDAQQITLRIGSVRLLRQN